MSHLRLHHHARVATALVLIALQALGAAHLALEVHVVDDAGHLVELHEFVEVHSHEGDSLCAASPSEVGADATDCDAARELSWVSIDALMVVEAAFAADAPSGSRREVTFARLWLWAPKGSPPSLA